MMRTIVFKNSRSTANGSLTGAVTGRTYPVVGGLVRVDARDAPSVRAIGRGHDGTPGPFVQVADSPVTAPSVAPSPLPDIVTEAETPAPASVPAPKSELKPVPPPETAEKLRCKARTQRGNRCRNLALPGSPYCRTHQPAEEA